MSIRIEDAIEFLETLGDELAGAGDMINADNVSEVIKLLEEQKGIHTPKIVYSDGDVYRCPNCGTLVMGKYGRCMECGQKYRP